MSDTLDQDIDEILLDLESHFAVPSITAQNAHSKAKAQLKALLVEARMSELENFRGEVHFREDMQQYVNEYIEDRIAQLTNQKENL